MADSSTLEVHPIARPSWASGDPLSPAVLDAAKACHVSPQRLLVLDAPTQTRCDLVATWRKTHPFEGAWEGASSSATIADSPITVSDPHEHACENPTSFIGVGRDVYFDGRCYLRAELNAAYSCHISPAEFRHMPADEQTNCEMAGAREAMARATTMTTPIPTPAATPFAVPACGGPLGLTHDCVSTVGATAPATYIPSSSWSPPSPSPYAPFLLAAIWALGGFVLVTGLLRRWTGW